MSRSLSGGYGRRRSTPCIDPMRRAATAPKHSPAAGVRWARDRSRPRQLVPRPEGSGAPAVLGRRPRTGYLVDPDRPGVVRYERPAWTPSATGQINVPLSIAVTSAF